MAKQIFYLTLVLLGLMLGRIVNATESMQMTMTLKPDGEMTLKMAGTGTLTIDWGDGKARKTYSLVNYNEEDWNQKKPMYRFSHTYSQKSKSIHTIVITGGNITHLECCNLRLMSLDVSKNTVLKELHCSSNQLTKLNVNNNLLLELLICQNNKLSNLDIKKNTAMTYLDFSFNKLKYLDVSKNTALIELNCWRNRLQKLDVSENTALTHLYCSENQFSILDMSNNIALTTLNCSNNRLSTFALNALFETLHNDNFPKSINILDNPGTVACNVDIATSKGWVVSHSIKGKEEIASRISPDEDEYTYYFITIVEDKPIFNGKDADKGFREFVNNNIIYPPDALKDGIEGKVFIQFSINQQGEVVDAEVLRGVHPLLNAEALRVINSSPKWTPAMQRGKPVKVTYSFPVEFNLNKYQFKNK